MFDLDAGAHHVPVQMLHDRADTFPLEQFSRLASALQELET